MTATNPEAAATPARQAAAPPATVAPVPVEAQASAGSANPGGIWDHLRFAFPAGANLSHDPSGYNGPRSFYVLTSWTKSAGTLLRFRFYADNYFPRTVNGQHVHPELTSRNFQASVKEIYIQHRFANSLDVTAGDIRATAHSDNNTRLYEGDGKPVHSDITEIDRVLGVSLSKKLSWGRVEFTVADRGRHDLRWDGLMETVRVSRASANGLREAQVTFVNRNGNDTFGVAAPHQWQFGVGGSIASPNRMDVMSVEYVHGNFFPKRISSTEAIGVAFERRLMRTGALSAVVDYERISGPTGLSFYEAGASALVRWVAASESHLRVDAGYRRLVPTATTQPIQHGLFVRVGIVFDYGKGSVRPAGRIFG